jgi:hypothetical protein
MRIVKVVLIVAALVMGIATQAVSNHWTSVEAVSARTGQACVGGTKIELPSGFTSGEFDVSFGGYAGKITITISKTAAGQTMAFETDHSSHLVTSVIVKGGPVSVPALKYNYSPGVESDSGLHASLNPNSGKWYGVSFACFQTVKADLLPA